MREATVARDNGAASRTAPTPRGWRRLLEAAVVLVVVGTATWLRVVHLDGPSLWWDELVELRTAQQPLATLLRIVRFGIAPGGGTAGAMPADYVLLHGFLAVVPWPAPERLEAYCRAPACAASIAAVRMPPSRFTRPAPGDRAPGAARRARP